MKQELDRKPNVFVSSGGRASRLLGAELIPVFIEYPVDEGEFGMVGEYMLSMVKMLVNPR